MYKDKSTAGTFVLVALPVYKFLEQQSGPSQQQKNRLTNKRMDVDSVPQNQQNFSFLRQTP